MDDLDELRRAFHELSQLYELTASLGESMPATARFARFLDKLTRALAIDVGAVVVCDPRQPACTPEVRASVGIRRRDLPAVCICDALRDRLRQARTCRSLVAPEEAIRELDGLLPFLAGRMRAGLVVALHAGDHVVGLLVLAHLRPRTFPDPTQRLIERLAQRLAVAIDHALVYEELVRKADEAEAANLAKGQFLANMSHEIRTPMNAVLGMIELALGSATDEEQRKLLAIARSSASGLLSLLNDVLDFSRIEAGRLPLESIEFQPADAIESAVSVLSLAARDKGLDLAIALDPQLPPLLRGDPTRLRQVILNLVGNAVKFTSHGRVLVRAEVAERTDSQVTVHVAVQDTGPGVPPEKQSRIFQAFTQADASTTREFGGTGLGLAICRELVHLMGGALWLESQPGVGSTFHFTARLAAPVQESVAAEPAPDGDLAMTLDRLRHAKLRVLLAEDNPVNQLVARRFLEKLGCEVVVVGNGVDAVEKATRERFAAVLMDVQMPQLDGMGATVAIRELEDDGHTRLPVIALTAHAMEGYRGQCLAAGMDGYLTKPLDLAALARTLERFVPAAVAG